MSVTVILGEDALAPDTWERHDVDDVCAFLAARYDKFPDTARIYHNQVAQNCDVTPSDEWGIKRLQKLDGTLYVIVYPGDPVTIIIAVVAVAAVAAAAFLLLPKIPNSALRNTQTESPNNALSDRQNKPRPNGRIPDIYGTVRSTPDLIAVPYNVFVNHEEVEYAYMCVGRGEYDISEDEIRDDTTLAQSIAGTSVEVYGPYTSPNSGHEPEVRVGLEITEPVRTAVRSNAVNGQVLRPPNADSYAALDDVRFVYPDEIHVKSSSEVDFTDIFVVGDTLSVSNAATSAVISGSGVDVSRSAKFTDTGTVVFFSTDTSLFSVGDTLTITGAYFEYNSGANAIDLSGTYVIQALTTDTITLDNPEDTNSDWNLLAANFALGETSYKTCGFAVPDGLVNVDLSGAYSILGVDANIITLANPAAINVDWNIVNSFPDNRTEYISPILQTTADKWIGPFILDRADLTYIYANFVALNGLYKDNGENQKQFNVVVELEATPVDNLDVPTGAAETFQRTIFGSSTSRTTRAVTMKADPTFTGRCSVRARRVTPADLNFKGTVVDEIKWRDVYQMSPVSQTDFGNVTTVHAVTLATSGALSLKDRKLNMIASRKVPLRVSGSTFTPDTYVTNSVADILCAISLDPRIGNRNVAELDVDNIYDTVAEIVAYFGTPLAAEFNYTFDNDNLSYEETVATIASAVFCSAYRRGNVIKLKFDRSTEDSVLLFNHRNKLPGTEERTVRFGNQDDNDGVEYNYVDPEDDALVTLYVPETKEAVNPKKVDSIGVRSRELAFFHAWRIWNKTRYQNVATEFEATQEADLLLVSDRILVADNTRPGTQDGEVIAQNGLSLELSQEVAFEGGEDYTIFLQHVDGSVEAIPVTAGASSRLVTLAYAPKAALSLEQDAYARALYQIVAASSRREQAFLVTEKEPQDNFTSVVRAVNYDYKYYLSDALLMHASFYQQSYLYNLGFGNETLLLRGGAVKAIEGAYRVISLSSAGDAVEVLANNPQPDSYTFGAWVKPNALSTGNRQSILASVGTSSSARTLYLAGTSNYIVAAHGQPVNGGNQILGQYPNDGAWHYVTLVYDAATNTLSLYLDGELIDSRNDATDYDRTLDYYIGAFNTVDGSNFFGKIREPKLYAKAFDADGVKALYRAAN